MDAYLIVAIRKVDYPFTPGEVEVLEFLDEVGETSIDTLDNIAKSIEGIGPIDLPFIFGFTEGFLKKAMMRTLLDVMRKKGLIEIKDGKVKITENGRIAIRGVKEKKDLEKLSSTFRASKDGKHLLLESGYYLATLDRPFESDGIVIPNCYLGLHTQFVRRGERHIEFIVPMRTLIEVPCKIELVPLSLPRT